MITLHLTPEERPVRVMPQEGFVYQNTKGNYVLVLSVNEHSAQTLTFNTVNGKLIGIFNYAFHCITKWPLVGRATQLPQIEVESLTAEDISSFERYRGI